MLRNGPCTVNDDYYGALTILTDAERGTVEVAGEQVPTVVIQRSPRVEPNASVPIGTREAAHLTATIDGVDAELRPGKGKLTRASHRVVLALADTHYSFVPDSDDTTQLRRDSTKLASFELLDVKGGDEFIVRWLVERDDTRPGDAAIGYALSVAFRTGAVGIITVLTNGSENVPGTP